MSLPIYPKYKNSGTHWLAEAPSHWRVVPLWTLFRRTKRTGYETEQLLSVYRDFGVIPKASRDDNNNKPSDDLSVYQLVEPGDLTINKMKAWQGAVAISDYRGIVSPAYFIYEAIHNQDARFLHYLLRSPRYVTGYLTISKGIRVNQWDLEPQYHSRMPVLLPPREEQTSIAAFLDRETSKIDALVAEQEKLLTLLAEKHQATVSHAVTRGLDASAPMKHSGVAWLGEVPAHWSLAPLASRYHVQLGKMLDSAKITGTNLRRYLRVFDVQWGDINTEDLPVMDFDEDARAKFRLAPGDILVNEGGSYPGRAAIWTGALDECYYQKALHRLRPHSTERDTSQFFYYALFWAAHKGVFVYGGNETTIEHLPAERLRRYRFAFPPLEEQLQIAKFLNTEIAKLDTLKAEAERAIELLKERRSALIAAAVTGKIDVRNAVPEELAA
jgi:type I restriction enzyme S subunit